MQENLSLGLLTSGGLNNVSAPASARLLVPTEIQKVLSRESV